MTCIVLIPIYKTQLSIDEERNIKDSLTYLPSRLCEISFLAPVNIPKEYYESEFSSIRFSFFEPTYFRSVNDYSRLLLDHSFYRSFVGFDHMLILQTDAVVLLPTLDYWLSEPYDYIGAPWMKGWQFDMPVRLGGQLEMISLNGFVGNGGLSLRRIASILRLFEEFPDARKYFQDMGFPEDLAISLMASLSRFFRVPTIGVASCFSRETDREIFDSLTSAKPFGLHIPQTSRYVAHQVSN